MIRLYKKGDEVKINQLYEKVFGKTRSLNEWDWKFNHFSSPSAIIIVAEEDNRIVGHAACLKIEAAQQSRSVLLAERVDIMVDPDFQGRGIYKKIVARMLEECERQNIDILYGFPAAKAKTVFVSSAQATDLGNVPRFSAFNKPAALLAAKFPRLSFVKRAANKLYSLVPAKETSFSMRQLGPSEMNLVDILYNRYLEDYPLHAKRGSDYVQRRFLDHPEKDYRLYALNDGIEDCGYAVLYREKAANGVCIETIVDLWGPNNSQKLIGMFQTIRRNSNADMMNVWAVKGSERYAALKRAGFFHINSPMPFVVKSFESSLPADHLDAWHLSQSDADSY